MKEIKTKKINFVRIPTNRFATVDMTSKQLGQILEGISGRNLLKKRKIDYHLYTYTIINAINQNT